METKVVRKPFVKIQKLDLKCKCANVQMCKCANLILNLIGQTCGSLSIFSCFRHVADDEPSTIEMPFPTDVCIAIFSG